MEIPRACVRVLYTSTYTVRACAAADALTMLQERLIREGFKKKKKVRNFPHFSKPPHPTRKVRKKK